MTKTIEQLNEELKKMEDKKAEAIKNQNYELAANFRDRATEIRKQIDGINNKHSR